MKSKYSDTYFAFQYAVKHKDYHKVVFACDSGRWHLEHSCLTNWGNSREVLFTARARSCETQHNWHNSLACRRSPVYSAALSAVLTFLLAAFQPTTPVFPSTLALNMEDAYTVLCDIRPATKSSPCLLPSHPSQPSDWSCQGSLRPRSCSQASFLSDTPTDSSSQVSRAFAILSTSSPVSSVKKSRPASQNYGNSLVVFTTLKNQTSLILTTSLATAKYTTGICLLRASYPEPPHFQKR